MSSSIKPVVSDAITAMAQQAQKLVQLPKLWKSALPQLNVMSEASDDPVVRETATTLMNEMRQASLPGESHHQFGSLLYRYCNLLEIDIQRVTSECSHSHDEMMMAEQEIEALQTLKEAAEAWAEVYTARYPSISNLTD